MTLHGIRHLQRRSPGSRSRRHFISNNRGKITPLSPNRIDCLNRHLRCHSPSGSQVGLTQTELLVRRKEIRWDSSLSFGHSTYLPSFLRFFLFRPVVGSTPTRSPPGTRTAPQHDRTTVQCTSEVTRRASRPVSTPLGRPWPGVLGETSRTPKRIVRFLLLVRVHSGKGTVVPRSPVDPTKGSRSLCSSATGQGKDRDCREWTLAVTVPPLSGHGSEDITVAGVRPRAPATGGSGAGRRRTAAAVAGSTCECVQRVSGPLQL